MDIGATGRDESDDLEVDEEILSLVAVHNTSMGATFSEADISRLMSFFKEQTQPLTVNQVQLVNQQHQQTHMQHESLTNLHQRLEYQANAQAQPQIEARAHLQQQLNFGIARCEWLLD